jgi:hypothetical protein
MVESVRTDQGTVGINLAPKYEDIQKKDPKSIESSDPSIDFQNIQMTKQETSHDNLVNIVETGPKNIDFTKSFNIDKNVFERKASPQKLNMGKSNPAPIRRPMTRFERQKKEQMEYQMRF